MLPVTSRWKRLALSAMALTSPLMAGCTAEPARETPPAAVRQERSTDSLQMAKLYAEWKQHHAGTQMPLDLGDAKQYAFVLKRLESAGNNLANSPRLFSSLAQQRERVLAEKAGGTVQAAQTTAEWCAHLLPLEEVAHGTSATTFQGSGYITCAGGADYSYVDFNAYSTTPERQEFQLLATTATEAYLAKTLETDPLDVVLDAGPDRVLFYDSMGMAYDEASGRMETFYSTADTTVLLLPPGLNFDHPRELIGGNLAGNAIRTCLERGSATGAMDCDYALAKKDTAGNVVAFAGGYTGVAAVNAPTSLTARRWTPDTAAYWPTPGTFSSSKLYLPAQGTYVTGLPSSCTVQSVTSEVSIILLSAGGRCKVANVAAVPGQVVLTGSLPLGAGVDASSLPFNGLMDLGTDCLGHEQDVAMQAFTTVNATCPRAGGGFSPVKRLGFRRLAVLDFKNSCLAAGTRVLRADGKSVPVESVQVGDQVLTHVGGRALTVTTVTKGTESQPLVRLKAGKGRGVLVTNRHPMVSRTRGVVAAGELAAGDVLLTRDGEAALTAVERVPYKGQVYNLTLGTDAELVDVGAKEHTLIANGFVVGDARMQTDLERQKHLPVPADLLAALPAAWHADYLNSQARRP
ncbi:Hint domain-containing protein [Pyxidicoccus trucidator]|uniref:Hint domain-containing protein n=1 Tax=Pyxidicoccus trucidator TaxID=2709662 RepID=UPI0013DD252F|nr:Hint domain-containing protein [Pyxidicoccus trucidator]